MKNFFILNLNKYRVKIPNVINMIDFLGTLISLSIFIIPSNKRAEPIIDNNTVFAVKIHAAIFIILLYLLDSNNISTECVIGVILLFSLLLFNNRLVS